MSARPFRPLLRRLWDDLRGVALAKDGTEEELGLKVCIPFSATASMSLGQLQFQGPFLVRDGKCLFPVPLYLLGRAADHAISAQPFWSPSVFLAPKLMAPFWRATWGQFVFLFPSGRMANVDH